MEEIWKPVIGWEDRYEVSNIGRVKSIPRKYMNNGGKCISKERILSPRINSGGYIDASLNRDGYTKQERVHRLVSQAFITNPDNKPQVNHINGIKTDNRVENLEWCTQSENNSEAYRIGSRPLGKGRYSPVGIIQYSLEGNLIKNWISARYIERELGFTTSGISQCCKGKIKSFKGYIWKYKNPSD